MITPTNGRQVWYWRSGATYGVNQPEAATVCYVQHDRLVNLQVLDQNGTSRGERNVVLRQPEDPELAQQVVVESPFCEWMPYQKDQAAKTEQIRSVIASGQPGKRADER